MKLSCTKSLILFICGVILINAYAFAQEDEEESSGSSSYPTTSFTVPDKLRNRVNFWKSVFVDYGENDIIVHHRMYPQSVFSVVDISDVTDGYSDVQRELYRKKKEEEIVKTVKNAFKNIIEQGEPATILEERIYKSMKAIPGGSSKFERAIDEDLIRTQLGIRERYRQAIIESGRYLPLMEQIFRNYGLPVELTRLPFVESSFNLKAKSSVGALGLWQFMAATAKSYMTVNSLVDERRDPIISTHAAAKYFLGAKARLGSWPFAITSYNHGVSGMARKISQIGLTNIADIIEHPSERVLGFASNNFYPSFLAAVEVYREKEEYFPKIKQDRVIRYKERALGYTFIACHSTSC